MPLQVRRSVRVLDSSVARPSGNISLFFACITGACAVFFDAMLAELGAGTTARAWPVVAILAALAAMLLNLRESVHTTRLLLAIGLIGIIVMVVLCGIIIGTVASGTDEVTTGVDFTALSPGDASWTAVMTASVFGFLSWAGFESGASLGEETRDPKYTIPRALTLAVILAGLLYTLVMFAQTTGFGTDESGQHAFASASSTLTALSSVYVGPWFATTIAVIATLVAFGSLLSSMAAASRLVFALARDGFGPKALARTSSATGVPMTATICVASLTGTLTIMLAIVGGGPVELYYWFATIGTLCMVVAYGMTSIGLLRHAFRPESPLRKWEAVIPAFALTYLGYVYLVQAEGQTSPYSYFPWVAGAWCLTGAIVILAAPGLAGQIGARLTVEDLG